MSENARMPELPVTGTVVSRTVQSYAMKNNYADVSLLIVPDHVPEGEETPLIYHNVILNGKPDPSSHLLPGHRVKIKELSKVSYYFVVGELTFDVRQFLPAKGSNQEAASGRE